MKLFLLFFLIVYLLYLSTFILPWFVTGKLNINKANKALYLCMETEIERSKHIFCLHNVLIYSRILGQIISFLKNILL